MNFNLTVSHFLIPFLFVFVQQRSVQHYEQAADYFKGEEQTSSANKCLLKVAQYAAQLEDYDKAIQIYEQVMHIAFGFTQVAFKLTLVKLSNLP